VQKIVSYLSDKVKNRISANWKQNHLEASVSFFFFFSSREKLFNLLFKKYFDFLIQRIKAG